jgi:hypothetical protein
VYVGIDPNARGDKTGAKDDQDESCGNGNVMHG